MKHAYTHGSYNIGHYRHDRTARSTAKIIVLIRKEEEKWRSGRASRESRYIRTFRRRLASGLSRPPRSMGLCSAESFLIDDLNHRPGERLCRRSVRGQRFFNTQTFAHSPRPLLELLSVVPRQSLDVMIAGILTTHVRPQTRRGWFYSGNHFQISGYEVSVGVGGRRGGGGRGDRRNESWPRTGGVDWSVVKSFQKKKGEKIQNKNKLRAKENNSRE